MITCRECSVCVGSNEAKILFVSSFSQHDCLGSHNNSVDYEMPFDLTV